MDEKQPGTAGRKFMKKGDAILLGILLAAALLGVGYYAFLRSCPTGTGANYAVLSYDGVPVAAYDLGEHLEESTLSIREVTGVDAQLEFSQGRVRFIQVPCPDKICESVGYIQNEMDGAVCLPNKMSLLIYTPEEYEQLQIEEK